MKKSKDIKKGKGFGYYSKKTICMIRCFKCGKENHSMMVAFGSCAWCDHNPNKKELIRNLINED